MFSRAGFCATMAALVMATSSPSRSMACGYHLDDVSLERAGLNIVYPESMHVVGAIATAQAAKRLPAPALIRDLFAYHRTVRTLERLEEELRPASGGAKRLPFSLVFIERMLWTRFDFEGEQRMQVHVAGPQSEDLVLVSGEEVIEEVANNRLGIDEAWKLGLVRLYGSETQVARFLATYGKIGSPRVTSKSKPSD